MAYSTLIFDLSEVLVFGLWGAEHGLGERLGLPEKRVAQELWIPWATSLFEGRLTEQQYLDEVIRKAGWQNITAFEVGVYLRENFRRSVPGMQELIRRLAPRYELALLTDHAREWVEYIREQHPVLECFAHQFTSYELRHTKRERVTFLTVLYKLGRQAGECVFVDDLATNIEVARSVGIHALQFKDAATVGRGLAEAGIQRRIGTFRATLASSNQPPPHQGHPSCSMGDPGYWCCLPPASMMINMVI